MSADEKHEKDAVRIVHNRYIKGDPEREKELERERHTMTTDDKKLHEDALKYTKEFASCCLPGKLEDVDADIVFEAVRYTLRRERERKYIRGES